MAAWGPGASCTAQPVTTMRAAGRVRRSRRMAWRAWRSASAVTAQGWTITISPEQAAAARRRITSDSMVLRRQPKVTTSIPASAGIGEQLRRQHPGERLGGGGDHGDAHLARPGEPEFAAVQAGAGPVTDQAAPRGRDHGRTG